MPQAHETILARAEAFFGQRLTPPLLEHPAKPLSAGRLRRRDGGQDRLNSAEQYGDLGTCYRALGDLGGFELQDQRNIGHLLYPTPVRLGAWEGKPDLLALVLGEEESRWVSFYRPEQGEVRLASIDWELRGGSGIGRFFFDQPMPRLQVWTGSPPEVAVETICSPSGDLDFVSPAGYFEGTQVAFSRAGDYATMAFGESGADRTVQRGSRACHIFDGGENKTTTVEVEIVDPNIVAPNTAGFTVMVRGADGDLKLYITVSIRAKDFEPHLILNRVLFNPQELEKLVSVIWMPEQIRR